MGRAARAGSAALTRTSCGPMSRRAASSIPVSRCCWSTTASSWRASSGRSRRTDGYDVTTPYGYGGPVGEGRILLRAVRGLVRRARGSSRPSSATTRCSRTIAAHRTRPTSVRRSAGRSGRPARGHARQAPQRRPQGAEGRRRRGRNPGARRPLDVRRAVRADDGTAGRHRVLLLPNSSTGNG